MIQMTPEQIVKLWDAEGITTAPAMASGMAGGQVTGWMSPRAKRLRRYFYYRGEQVVDDLMGVKRIDGRTKTAARTTWLKTACDMHAGFLFANRVNYTTAAGETAAPELRELLRIYDANGVWAMDMEHLVNAMLYGFSVEIHSFDGAAVVIRGTEPLGWTFVRDETGEIVTGIYRKMIPAGTFYRGELLAAEREVFTAYDAQTVRTLERVKGIVGLTETVEHVYGRLPLAVFQIGKRLESFFSDAFLDVCDLYDVIRCSLADDIKYNVDSLLALKGLDFKQLMARKDPNDPNSPTVWEHMLRAMKLIVLPEGASADFISRTIDIEKFKYDLRVSRGALHMMACIPDLTDTINGNGASQPISGIALKLMFQSMIQKASEFANYLEGGFRTRIALVNAIHGVLMRPTLEDYELRFQRNIPQNDTEWMQYAPNLANVVAAKDTLKLLPFIQDPDQAYANLVEERGAKAKESEREREREIKETMPAKPAGDTGQGSEN